MAEFHPNYPLAGLTGAIYNPRRIDEGSLEALRHSVRTLGIVKPIIATVGGITLAGHQRSKALLSAGITHAPVVLLPNVSAESEVRFNQLHNGVDFDSGDEDVVVAPSTSAGYEETPVVSGNGRAKLAALRKEIAALLLRYGNWGGCVATQSGKVIHAAQYALACQAIRMPARVCRIPDSLEDAARELLSRQYGVFSYEHIERRTYIQTFAQMFRLRTANGATKENASALYVTSVLPYLKPGDRVLDFGCGQADYVNALRNKGIQIFGVEFFFRKAKTNLIDAAAVHRMIDAVAADLRANGLFDVVLADSVLNSVDSMQAEADVLTCLNTLCRPGGKVCFSGRTMESVEAGLRKRTDAPRTKTKRNIEFLDENGFTSLYREGSWFFQKFHSKLQAQQLAEKYIGNNFRYRMTSTSWQIEGVKSIEMPESQAEASIRREFDLMWPGGRSVGRADVILSAWREAQVRTLTRQIANSGMK